MAAPLAAPEAASPPVVVVMPFLADRSAWPGS
jgi:hypothetical protein